MTEIGAVERPKSSFMDMKYAVANGEIRFVSSIYNFERAPCPPHVLTNPILCLFTYRVLSALVVAERCVKLSFVLYESDAVEECVAVRLLIPLLYDMEIDLTDLR